MRKRYVLIAVLGVCVAGLAAALVMFLNPGESQGIHSFTLKDGDTATIQYSNGNTVDIRYASINAPGGAQTLGKTALIYEKQLIKGAPKIVVDVKPSNEGKDGNGLYGRKLAYVFLDTGRKVDDNVSVILVSEGFARLDVRNPSDKNIESGDDFDVQYAEEIINAQIKAAMTRQGWWGLDDANAGSRVAIAAIRQWSADETVYIVNRSEETIDFSSGWKLSDNNNPPLVFSEFPNCSLLPGKVLRVHSGPVVDAKLGQVLRRDTDDIDLYWRSDHIWNQDKDVATLSDPTGNLVYSYHYPLTETYWK